MTFAKVSLESPYKVLQMPRKVHPKTYFPSNYGDRLDPLFIIKPLFILGSKAKYPRIIEGVIIIKRFNHVKNHLSKCVFFGVNQSIFINIYTSAIILCLRQRRYFCHQKKIDWDLTSISLRLEVLFPPRLSLLTFYKGQGSAQTSKYD